MQKDTTMTSLLFGKRVSKLYPRVEVCGLVDELNSQLGVCRVVVDREDVRECIVKIQQQLLRLGSEMGVDDADQEQYRVIYGEKMLAESDLSFLEHLQKTFGGVGKEFVLPGETLANAHLHVARCICRRLELKAIALKPLGHIVRELLISYLNLLSKTLFVLARSAVR